MSILTDLKELLLPRCCPVCGQLMMEGEEVLCANCAIQMPRVRIINIADNIMLRKLWSWVDVRYACTYMSYNHFSPFHNLITTMKYRGCADIGVRMGHWAALDGRKNGFWQHADALVPVPMTRWKAFKRGYNQAEMIARGISEVTGLPIVGLIRRTGGYTSQTRLSAEERVRNAEGIYQADIPETWRGKRLVIIDDVMTTGATLASCARALRKADAEAEINIFTIGFSL